MGTSAYDAIAVLCEQQTSGTNGGTFTSGARRTRTLNTKAYDGDSIVTLSSNQFTLAAGTYEIEAWMPAYECRALKGWLYNVTDAADALASLSQYAAETSSDGTITYLSGVITIASSKTFELQHQCGLTNTDNGFGESTGWGTEQYSVVVIRRRAAASDQQTAIVCHQETSGTDGGGLSSGAWRTRTLNTELFDPDNIVTLSGNQFTLAAGTYEIIGVAPNYGGGITQTRVYNATDASVEFIGSNSTTSNSNKFDSLGISIGVVTLATIKALELQQRVTVTEASLGEGVATSFDVEQYGTVYIRKIS